jgi:hypothetical protein
MLGSVASAHGLPSGEPAIDKLQLALRRVARCAIASDLEEFGELPEEGG